MKIKCLHDWIYVQEIKEQEQTQGGIILANTGKEPSRGKVLAVGPGRYDNGILLPMSVQVGDTVLIGKYSKEEFSVKGERFLMCRDSDTYGVVLPEVEE
jgi:chaperonin GroES